MRRCLVGELDRRVENVLCVEIDEHDFILV